MYLQYLIIIDINSCTFSIAGFSNPINQYMYRCSSCEINICLICRFRCHSKHTTELLGIVRETFCTCPRLTCLALAGSDRREVEGMKYIPKPIKPYQMKIDDNLSKLGEKLAQNYHLYWCKERISNGYKYGTIKDDYFLTNPMLLPWEKLSEHEKQKNLDFVMYSLMVITYIG